MTIVGPYRYCNISPDNDNDGVPNYLDACVDTPGLPTYNGCPPPDTDGDGVTDDVDQCPTTPGVAPVGCPDADGDGVYDPPFPGPTDQCPTTVGVAPVGCPDADGDGIYDPPYPGQTDLCPTTAGLTPFGCPDTDGDGVFEPPFPGYSGYPIDQCVGELGPPSNQGCPIDYDFDDDGVLDVDDRCPTVFGYLDSLLGPGCPHEMPAPEPTPTALPPVKIVTALSPDPFAPCNLTAQPGNTLEVNVRSQPTTNSVALGQFLRSEGRFGVTRIDEENNFYGIMFNGVEGWVSMSVSRIGGLNCNTLNGRPTVDSLAPKGYDSIINPVLDVLPPDIEAITYKSVDVLLGGCPQLAPEFVQYALTLAKGNDGVTLLNALIDQIGAAGSACDNTLAVLRGTMPLTNLPPEAVVDATIARCLPNSTVSHRERIGVYVKDFALNLNETDADACALVKGVIALEDFTPTEDAFYKGLQDSCKLKPNAAFKITHYALQLGVDVRDVVTTVGKAAEGSDDCDVSGILENITKRRGRPPAANNRFAACPDWEAQFLRLNPAAEVRERITNALDSCSAASDFLNYRKTPELPANASFLPVLGSPEAPELPVEVALGSSPDTPAGFTTVEVTPILETPLTVVEEVIGGGGGGGETTKTRVEAAVILTPRIVRDDLSEGVGLFIGISADGKSTDIYYLKHGEAVPLTPNTGESETSLAYEPISKRFAYLRTGADGVSRLIIHYGLYEKFAGQIDAPTGLAFVPESRLAWYGGQEMWATLQDESGGRHIGRIKVDLCRENNASPDCIRVVVANAANPVVINANLYYERQEGERSLIFYRKATALNNETLYKDQPEGASCTYPSTWREKGIMFLCTVPNQRGTMIYFGLGNIAPILLPNFPRITRLESVKYTTLYVTFDDGTKTYLVSVEGESKGKVQEYIASRGKAYGLQWMGR
ncbi:MAG TPA: SH3 domain-containing protein [Aggregatilineales bacterium]|nr:SH3 domain-containing protein [Anaerolineales bacterium]HRE49732.1 SH3 domain-containing protein [Aggregatilineales bacterium]